MYKLIKKEYSINGGYYDEIYYKVKVNSSTYNGVYKIDLSVQEANMYLATSEKEECGGISEENFKALNEIFELMNTPNTFGPKVSCVPVYAYHITFCVNDLYVKDDKLFFKNVSDVTFETEGSVKIYIPNESVNDFNSLVATGDKTSIILSHSKGKNILDELATNFDKSAIVEPEGYGDIENWEFNFGYDFVEED